LSEISGTIVRPTDDDASQPKGKFIVFYATWDEMSDVVSRCIPIDNYGWAICSRSIRSGV